MFNFNAVNETVFNAIITDNPHRASDHGCIDGGQIYRDHDDKILAAALRDGHGTEVMRCRSHRNVRLQKRTYALQ